MPVGAPRDVLIGADIGEDGDRQQRPVYDLQRIQRVTALGYGVAKIFRVVETAAGAVKFWFLPREASALIGVAWPSSTPAQVESLVRQPGQPATIMSPHTLETVIYMRLLLPICTFLTNTSTAITIAPRSGSSNSDPFVTLVACWPSDNQACNPIWQVLFLHIRH